MMPTEYTIHEHRRELERTAAQIRFAKLARPESISLARRLATAVNQMRRRLRRPMTVPQTVPAPLTQRRLA